jgi:hypothetical protein
MDSGVPLFPGIHGLQYDKAFFNQLQLSSRSSNNCVVINDDTVIGSPITTSLIIRFTMSTRSLTPSFKKSLTLTLREKKLF